MATKITALKIKQDWKRAKAFDSKWAKVADEDLKMALGQQWDDKDKATLEAQGRPCLTLNIIQSLIFLVSGYQRQSRSTIRAYPEGGEDAVASEIVTRLIKNVMKRSKYGLKESEAFENGIITGKAYLEGYMDYNDDLINGRLNFVAADPYEWGVDPRSTEYDLADARYCVKRTLRTMDELLELFPDDKAKLDKATKYNQVTTGEKSDEDDLLAKNEDYPSAEMMESEGNPLNAFADDVGTGEEGESEEDLHEDEYELFEYYYKNYITKFLAIDVDRDRAQIFSTEDEANEWLVNLQNAEPLDFVTVNEDGTQGRTEVTKIHTPHIYLASSVGGQMIEDDQAPSFPRWKGYPIIPLLAHYTALAKKRLKRSDLAYQGIVRSLKDAQIEKNKRRSQVLNIINSVANAGWMFEEDSWVNPDLVKKFGTTPGVHLEYKKGYQPPQRIEPASVPNSHLLAESEAEADIKKISGINADLLAQDQGGSDSGRAIALRQKQGMLMLKRIFDNLAWTHEIAGGYIVAHLPDLFTADKAMKVLGSEFIMDTFRQHDDESPQLIIARAHERIGQILSDDEITKYDIALGEGLETPTERYATYSMLLDLNEKYPGAIPPQVVMDYSDLPADAKQKVVKGIETAMQTQPPGAAGAV